MKFLLSPPRLSPCPVLPPPESLGEYDRIIDATGVRSYLPAAIGIRKLNAVETRCVTSEVKYPTINSSISRSVWALPLGFGATHVGATSISGEAEAQTNDLREKIGASKIICSCQGSKGCSGLLQPFVAGKVWGLGESIGLVDPLTGAGIVPAVVSAKLMADNWDNPAEYEKAILANFSYIDRAAEVARKIIDGQGTLPDYLLIFLRSANRSGIKISFFDAPGLKSA